MSEREQCGDTGPAWVVFVGYGTPMQAVRGDAVTRMVHDQCGRVAEVGVAGLASAIDLTGPTWLSAVPFEETVRAVRFGGIIRCYNPGGCTKLPQWVYDLTGVDRAEDERVHPPVVPPDGGV